MIEPTNNPATDWREGLKREIAARAATNPAFADALFPKHSGERHFVVFQAGLKIYYKRAARALLADSIFEQIESQHN